MIASARLSRLLTSGAPLRATARIPLSLLRRRVPVAASQQVVVRYGQCKIQADLRTNLGLFLYRYGTISRDVQLVVDALSPGDVFIDGGANVGLFTLPAARKVGPRGSVVAIEPGRISERLLENIALNDLANVTVVHAALDERSGERRFLDLDGDAAGLSSFESLGSRANSSATVPTCTLDSLTVGLEGRLRVVKLDLEGAEAAALRGAERLLAGVKYFLVEVEDGHLRRQGSSAAELTAMFESAGYRATHRADAPNIWFERA